jgi:hypothetical protein
MIGSEEILRQMLVQRDKDAYVDMHKALVDPEVLEKTTAEMFTDPTTRNREFGCRVTSMTAVVYFLKMDEFTSYLRTSPTEDIRDVYMLRKFVL